MLHRWLKALSGLQVVFVFYGSWLAVSVIAESFGELADAPICTSGALVSTQAIAITTHNPGDGSERLLAV